MINDRDWQAHHGLYYTSNTNLAVTEKGARLVSVDSSSSLSRFSFHTLLLYCAVDDRIDVQKKELNECFILIF